MNTLVAATSGRTRRTIFLSLSRSSTQYAILSVLKVQVPSRQHSWCRKRPLSLFSFLPSSVRGRPKCGFRHSISVSPSRNNQAQFEHFPKVHSLSSFNWPFAHPSTSSNVEIVCQSNVHSNNLKVQCLCNHTYANTTVRNLQPRTRVKFSSVTG